MSIKLDDLAKSLFDDIKKNNDLFETKYVIVPSVKMESYLKAYYLKNNDSVLMNVKFMTFNKAILDLFNIKYGLADRNQIRSVIIKYLDKNKSMIKNQEVVTYLESSNYEIKLFDMASELTSLFSDLEKDNELNKLEAWQKEIYDYVLKELNGVNQLITLSEVSRNLKDLDKLVYLFGFLHYTKLEEEILKKLKNKKEYKLDINTPSGFNKLEIVRAPSKIREIEYIHSKICELLLEDQNIKFSDFLVVGTNMSDYEDVIARVFNQDDINYPNIPYYINAPKVKNNNVYNALRTIKEIVYKGFFSRLDFDNLINNKAIMYVRGILDNDISTWRDTICNINVYYTNEEWNYAIKRILLSKITGINDENNIVSLHVNDKDNDYIPYSSIGFDDDSIVRFIKMIDDLNNIINVFKGDEVKVDEAWIESFKDALDRFLSIKDANELETNGYYKKVSDVFNYWITNEIYDVPRKTFLETLIDVSKRSVTNKGELYTSGISFTEFEKNTILSAKYIFFINASSANLPIKKMKNSLINNQLISYKEEQEAFNSYYNNCEKIFISFVYKDLVKDEEFFLSNFVKELEDTTITEIKDKDDENKFKEENIPTIHIDEDGEIIKKIFTRRGQKNLEYRKNLLNDIGNQQDEREIVDTTKQVRTNVVTTSQLGKFLDEPLSSKAERLFGSSDDIREDFEEEYSPFELNGLDSYSLFKKVFIELFKFDDKEEKKKELQVEFNLYHQLPNITEVINDKSFDDIIQNYDDLNFRITKFGDPKIVKLEDVTFITNGGIEWTLKNNDEFVRVIKEDNTRIYVPIKASKIKSKDKLVMLAVALMDVAVLNEVEYKIGLGDDKNIITLNKSKAINMLNRIYESFIDYNNNYFMSYELLGKNKDKEGNIIEKIQSALTTLYDLFKSVEDSWEYFKEKKLFDYSSDLGYDEKKYYDIASHSGQIIDARDKQEELMNVIFKEDESEAE